ncbi:MAG: PocR ligand-binding domain-containing protein [Desulfovibrionaceae bacterium]
MKMTDLMSLEDWEKLEKELHERFGLNAAASDAEGVRLTKYANWGNPLCPRIKGDPKGLSAICAVAGRHFNTTCQSSRSPLVEECDAGLVKIAVPVIKDGEYLGCVGGCGLLFEDSEVETFLVSKSLEIEESEAERLAADVTSISHDRADEIVLYLKDRLAQLGADAVN